MPSKPTPEPSGTHAQQPVLEPILLVDDNPTNLQVLYKTLQGRGYKLLIAKSGEDALGIARKAKPILILLDIMMPGIDGYETCRRLKADPDMNAAVIFMSALNETHDKVKGLDLGAVDYISKPFQAEEVIARVNTHLTIERLNRELLKKNASLEQANEKMKRDLAAAARVQQALLPTELPLCDQAKFAWVYRPCDELGGDALNVFRIDGRFIGLYVLDVSGHGVPASLLSVVVTRDLQPQRGVASVVTKLNDSSDGIVAVDPADVAIRLNALYPMSSNGQHYFTLLYGILDTETGRFRFVCAGHPGPIVMRRDGSTTRPEPGTIRIIVLGDSFSMASSTAIEDSIGRVIERTLNEAGVRAEVLNLSVSGYDLPQIERQIETDVRELHPDIVLLLQRTWEVDERLPTEEPDWNKRVASNQVLRSRQNPIRYYSFLRNLVPWREGIDRRLRGLLSRTKGKKPGPPAMPSFLGHFADQARLQGFKPAMGVMHPIDFRPALQPRFHTDLERLRKLTDVHAIPVFDALDVFPEHAEQNDYVIYPGNNHPNAKGHEAMGRAIAQQMLDTPGLLR